MAAGQTVNFQSFGNRIAQGPNYATQSQAIGDAVNEAIQEQRDREDRAREQERQAINDETRKMQLAQLKQQQYESLHVEGQSGLVGADQYINKASRGLVDAQSELVNQYKNGDLDADQFAAQSAIIKSQVPALQNANKALSDFQTQYQTLLESGQISKADNGEAGRLWSAMQAGEVALEPDETGNLVLKGIGEDTADISVPLNQINRIPKPLPKAQALTEIAKGPLQAIGDGPFDENKVYEALDNMFGTDNVANERMLKSIAVDQLGMSLDKANFLLSQSIDDETGGPGGATNELEQYVEHALYGAVKTQYDAAQQKKLDIQNRLAQQELNQRKTQQAIDAGNVQMLQTQKIIEEKEYQKEIAKEGREALQNRIVNAPIDDPQQFAATMTELGVSVAYDDKTEQYVALKNGKVVDRLGTDPNSVKRYVARKVNQPLDQPSPLQRSPFRRFGDWLTNLTK